MSETRSGLNAGQALRVTLGVLPFIGMLVLIPWVNRTEPFVLGLPFLLFWIVIWVVLTTVCMTIIYWIDPVNRSGADQ